MEAITNQNEIKLRWKEHFEELYNTQNKTDPDVLVEIPSMNLEKSTEDFLKTEIEQAIKELKRNKAPGIDNITAELIKAGGDTIVNALHVLLNKIYYSETVPEEWSRGIIIPIYKRKGDKMDCNNYRGITLLSIPGKVLSKVIQRRISAYVEEVLGEEQAGFRPGRSTIDQLFTIRQILEKYIETNNTCYINFIDYKQAFDSVWHVGLWQAMRNFGIEEKLINLIQTVYKKAENAVRVEHDLTEWFKTEVGTRQGCILSPTLFIIILEAIYRIATKDLNIGVKCYGENISNLKFADDVTLLADSRKDLQKLTDKVNITSQRFGLMINAAKTKTMAVSKTGEEKMRLTLGSTEIEQVKSFTYVGGQITSNGSHQEDIKQKIAKGLQTMGRLKRIWNCKEIKINTKIQIYNSIVIPQILYGSETWVTRKEDEKRLLVAEMSCLRRILGVSRLQKLRNEDIRQRIGLKNTIMDKIRKRRLTWYGHVNRMEDLRLPKKALYTYKDGKKGRGRPRKKWVDNIKEDLKEKQLTIVEGRKLTSDKKAWKCFLTSYCH